MKQRMLNTFTRKLKNEMFAKICTNIGYTILMAYYAIISWIIKVKKYNTAAITVENAKNIVNSQRMKPQMNDYEIINQEETDIDLSIIVPAYNVEKYIKDCLESILNQCMNFKVEIIVVNDGATDKTDDIIRQFKDERIKYIVQENKGLSGARNSGINVAKGRYITFVDSDDLMCENAINTMMSHIIREKADIVVGSYYTFCEGIDIRQNHLNKPQVLENDTAKIVKNPGYAWGKIYKRSLFKAIRFPMDAWYEDTLICSIVYRLCKKMVVLEDVVYGYRINPEGISQTARKAPKSLDHYWVMEDTLELASKVGLKNDEIQYDIVFNHMSTFLYRRVSLMPNDVIESAFIMACEMLDNIRPENYKIEGNKIRKDLELSFKTRNYKLWKLASFLV